MKLLYPLLSLLLSLPVASLAQDNAAEQIPPQNVHLDKPGDYDYYLPDLLRCIDYLKSTPLSDADSAHRKKVNAFILEWIVGSPNVTMSLNASVLDYAGADDRALPLFVAGYVEYAVRHPDSPEADYNVAGLKTVRDFYKERKGLKRSKKMDELAAMSDSRLQRVVADKIAEDKNGTK